MDQKRFKMEDQKESTGQQGRYGENNSYGIDKVWICPECETINA